MTRVCIVAAQRSPQGRFLGALARRSAVDLAVTTGRACLKNMAPAEIDHVILGNVLAAGQGMNIARQVAVGLALPLDRWAFTVNMMCASGMQAVILAAQAIQTRRAKVVLCGGTESMSNAPYLLDRARSGYKLGDAVLIDSLLRDGLVDSFSNEHMGLSAERVAAQCHIDRQAQDAFALLSHRNALRAQVQGEFDDELVPFDELQHDEHPRADTTAEKLAALKGVFQSDGSVTAGNASGINDGAAMLVLCDQDTAQKRDWPVLAVLGDWASVGCDPQVMGLGPVHATARLCQQQDMQIDDFDAIEINEAFAAQTLACVEALAIDATRLNCQGGAIALGHPIGASGARLVVHLAHRIARGECRKALATLCVGGGMGTAMIIEAP